MSRRLTPIKREGAYKKNRPLVRTQICLHSETLDALTGIAAQKSVTRLSVIRHALEAYISMYERSKEAV